MPQGLNLECGVVFKVTDVLVEWNLGSVFECKFSPDFANYCWVIYRNYVVASGERFSFSVSVNGQGALAFDV
jgi:hypothetical protein